MCYNAYMKWSQNKRCPRCNTKVPKEMVTCPKCQLNYNKFDSATNDEAKVALSQGEKDRVLMRKGCPSDIKKWKLLLLTIFLGYMGAHYYYVGRNTRGTIYSIFFVIGIMNAVITLIPNISPSGDLWEVFAFLVLFWGLVLVLWILDIVHIIFNNFKIPVSLPRK